jgi:hypothetical protein
MSDPITPQDPDEPTTSVQGQPPHVVAAAHEMEDEFRRHMLRSVAGRPTGDQLFKHGSVDGLAWAEAFVREFEGHEVTIGPDDDENVSRLAADTVHGWFANAIEAGKRAGAQHPEREGYPSAADAVRLTEGLRVLRAIHEDQYREGGEDERLEHLSETVDELLAGGTVRRDGEHREDSLPLSGGGVVNLPESISVWDYAGGGRYGRRLLWDVVIDDPEMLARHEFRDVPAADPTTAGVLALQEAYRREGFRCSARHGAGDERMLPVAFHCVHWAEVHRPGRHPRIDYDAPAPVVRLTDKTDPQSGLEQVEHLTTPEQLEGVPEVEWPAEPVRSPRAAPDGPSDDLDLLDRVAYVGPVPGTAVHDLPEYDAEAYRDRTVGSTGKVRGIEDGAVYVTWGSGDEGWVPRAYVAAPDSPQTREDDEA